MLKFFENCFFFLVKINLLDTNHHSVFIGAIFVPFCPKILRICYSMTCYYAHWRSAIWTCSWLWDHNISTSWGRVPKGTLSMRFTCYPNMMFLASPRLEICRFSDQLFWWIWAVQSWYSFWWLWENQNWSWSFIFTDFGHIYLNESGLEVWPKKSKPSPFDKKLKNHTKDQWLSQWESRTGWVSQLINRLQRFNLLFLSVTCFSDLSDKKYAW